MAVKTNYKQRYSTNTIQAASSGRKNQGQQTSASGRFSGTTQAMQNNSGGTVARGGKLITRRQRYYDVRVGMNNVDPQVISRLEAAGINPASVGYGGGGGRGLAGG